MRVRDGAARGAKDLDDFQVVEAARFRDVECRRIEFLIRASLAATLLPPLARPSLRSAVVDVILEHDPEKWTPVFG